VINFAEFVNSNLTNNYEMTLLSEKQIDVSWYPISFHFCTLHFKFTFRSKKLICFFLSETGNYMEAENKYSRAMRGAPADSLFGQFCLHALWFGNCNIRGL